MSLIKDISETKYRPIIMYTIFAVDTLLPGILILYVYNKGFLLESSIGLTILLGLAITLPIFILNFFIFFFSNSKYLTSFSPGELEVIPEEVRENIFENYLYSNLLTTGVFCFFCFYIFLICINLMILLSGSPPGIRQVVFSFSIVEGLFFFYRLYVFLMREIKSDNNKNPT